MTGWERQLTAILGCLLLASSGLVAAGPATVAATDGTSESNDANAASAPNEPPLADAGLDRSVPVNSTVYLDATGSSDPDGTIQGYDWRIEHPSGAYSRPDCRTCGRTQFVARTPGTYNVTVTVTDDDGATESDTLRVDVESTDRPTVSLSGPWAVVAGGSHDYTASASAGDERLARLDWSVDGDRVESESIEGDSATSALTYSFDSPGTYTLEAEVVDRIGRTTVTTRNVTVSEPETAEDDGDSTTSGGASSPGSGTDGGGGDETAPNADDTSDNRAPSVTASATGTVEPGATVDLYGDASDPDGDPLRLRWSTPASAFTIDEADREDASFTAPDVSSETEYTVQFRASDGDRSVTEHVSVTVDPGADSGDSSDSGGSSGDGPSVYNGITYTGEGCLQGASDAGSGNSCNDEQKALGGGDFLLIDMNQDRRIEMRGVTVLTIPASTRDPTVRMSDSELQSSIRESVLAQLREGSRNENDLLE